MLEFVTGNPFALAVVVVLVTATMFTAYNKTLEPDEAKVNKAFYKIAVLGIASNLALVYFLTRTGTAPLPPFE